MDFMKIFEISLNIWTKNIGGMERPRKTLKNIKINNNTYAKVIL